MSVLEGTGEAPAAESPVTFDSIAADSLASFESQAEPEAQPADAGDVTPAADGDLEVDGEAPEGEAPDAGEAGAESDQVLNALADLKREDVPEDLLPIYDRIIAAQKSMQADYTRKTTKIADAAKTLEQQVTEQVAARLAELTPAQPAVAPEAPANADPEAFLWNGLGDRVDYDAAMSSDDPKMLQVYISQQAAVTARREVLAAVQQVMAPQLQQVSQYIGANEQAQADGILSAFVAANPDIDAVANGTDMAIRLVEAGIAKDMDEAAPLVRSMLFADEHVAQAAQLGIRAGQQRAAAVKDAQGRFNVPAGGTAPKAPAASRLRGLSFDGIAKAVIAGTAEEE